MSADRLAEIRARADAATEGPWFQGRVGRRYESHRDVYSKREPEEPDSCDIATYVNSAEDAEFIAHAREDVPYLLDEVERLGQENQQLEAERDYRVSENAELHAEVERLRAENVANGTIHLMKRNEVEADRDRAEAVFARVRKLADEWEAGQATNRRALEKREFLPYKPPTPDDLLAAIEGTDS